MQEAIKVGVMADQTGALSPMGGASGSVRAPLAHRLAGIALRVRGGELGAADCYFEPAILGGRSEARKEARMKGSGRAYFVAFLLLLAGTINIVYGIAAVSNAHFLEGTQYPFGSLHT